MLYELLIMRIFNVVNVYYVYHKRRYKGLLGKEKLNCLYNFKILFQVLPSNQGRL